ncbi:helix-turn-helix transcriptional regulator [Sphingobacterium sp.]|uniref:helix-turn-helix transcriptional regulator n=1 Tax=Sphingobacterium sp. TaxID=341027 RepID=UPI0025F5DFFF|nr:AraC family transcriptional regulator [Sphingobacterium sp.]
MIKLIFGGEKICNSGILKVTLAMDGLEKVLLNNAHLQESWSLDEQVAHEMADTPPHYSFDIRTFSNRSFQFRQKTMKQYSSRMNVSEIVLPQGMHMMHSELTSTSDGYLCIDNAVPYVHVFFALNSDRQYYVDGELLGSCSPGHVQSYLFAAPQIIGLWHRRPAESFFEINIPISLFESHLPVDSSFGLKLRSLAEKSQTGILFDESRLISAQQKEIIAELLDTEMDKEWKSLYCFGKVLELLARTFDEQKVKGIALPIDNNLSPEMKKLMTKAKEIVESRLTDPPSLAQLSAELGTNENYLKKYFKLCYGTTIYGYVTASRMQKAKRLLAKGDRPINEISRFLGYSNPAHFSASFKKHFGVKPKFVQQASMNPS